MEQKSRTQNKKEAQALQKLGEQLVGLSPDQINKMIMSQELRDAVLFAKTIKKHGARRRQMQYIGTLMREIDPEPIRRAIEIIAQGKKRNVRAMQQIEKWRDGLVDGNDDLYEDILSRFPGAERQRLSRLVRNAQKEKEKNKPPKSSRALFRYLKELLESIQI